jgi:hypothetical protein
LILKNAPHPYPELYEAYRFDEPWDGPNNSRLATRIGDYYRRQGLDAESSDETSFVAVLELPDDFAPAVLRAMLTIAGGEPVPADPGKLGAKFIDAPPTPVH